MADTGSRKTGAVDDPDAATNVIGMPPPPGVGQEPRRRSARPDPETGEVRAGPGDAGLQDRPKVNTGTSGTRQMSNRRLGIGLGIAAFLTVCVVVVAIAF